MRTLLPLLFGFFSIVAFAVSKKSSVDKFEDYHAKSHSGNPLKLDDTSYNDLTLAPRNFTIVILLTAIEARFGCQLCRDFQPEWDLIAKSWNRGDKAGKTRVLYGTLDFSDGKATFQQVIISFNSERTRF